MPSFGKRLAESSVNQMSKTWILINPFATFGFLLGKVDNAAL